MAVYTNFSNVPNSASETAIHIPKNFDINRPAVMVLYFPGHGGSPKDAINRQQLEAQLAKSGVNAVLVALPLGHQRSEFHRMGPGFAEKFLAETAQKFATEYDWGAGQQVAHERFKNASVVLAAYSGGGAAAAKFMRQMMRSPNPGRVKGAILCDAMYSDVQTCRQFIMQGHKPFFISNYIDNTRNPATGINNRALEAGLPQGIMANAGDMLDPVRRVSIDKLTGRGAVHRDLVQNIFGKELARIFEQNPRQFAHAAGVTPNNPAA